MKFDKARDLVKLLMALCVALMLISLFSGGNPNLAAMTALISLISLISSFIVIGLFCKCPYCGKHIYLGLLKATHCPKCRRDLITGVKKKGKR